MHFLPWTENSTPDLDEDDPAQRITLFQKSPVGLSYKCPKLSQRQEYRWADEYGFYHGDIEIENPVGVIWTHACATLVKILEQSSNPNRIIEIIFQNQT